MFFKGVTLEVGDYIAFTSDQVPLPHVEAAVIAVKDGVLEVLSTFLVPFQHSGLFMEEQVKNLEVIHPAEIAIPQESRGRRFAKGQEVLINLQGHDVRAKVVSAFDGVVVARNGEDMLITAGALRFEAMS